MKFSDLAIGDLFTVNGCRMMKKTSRTAWLMHSGTKNSLVFYCGKNEIVKKVIL